MSRRSDSVLVCGDVERNPGPVIKYCLPKNLLVLQGRTQEGADGAKALPEIKKNIYSFKYGTFYVLQFVQRS